MTRTIREPQPAYVEILEPVRGAQTIEEAEAQLDGMIVPRVVRLNGVPLRVPRGEAITLHETEVSGEDVVKVTLTLFARRIVIGAEAVPEPEPEDQG